MAVALAWVPRRAAPCVPPPITECWCWCMAYPCVAVRERLAADYTVRCAHPYTLASCWTSLGGGV